jgi:hypothetical protein
VAKVHRLILDHGKDAALRFDVDRAVVAPAANNGQRPAPSERGAGAPFHQQEDIMTRAISLTLVLPALSAALPAAAQDSRGLRLRSNPLATLDLIDADASLQGQRGALATTTFTR